MSGDELIKGALPQVRFDAVCVPNQRESIAVVRITCGSHGKHMRDDAEPIRFYISPQHCERRVAPHGTYAS